MLAAAAAQLRRFCYAVHNVCSTQVPSKVMSREAMPLLEEVCQGQPSAMSRVLWVCDRDRWSRLVR